MQKNDRNLCTNKITMDPSITYINNTFRTSYPYGLNEQNGEEYKKDKTELATPRILNLDKFDISINYKYANKIFSNEFLFKSNKTVIDKLPNTMNF